MGRHSIATAALSAFLLLAICAAIGAQQADRPAHVFVSVTAGPGGDPAYQTLLSDALIVTLARGRMKASADATADAARAAARNGGADYLVLGTWGNTTDPLELVVEAWLPNGTAALASGKASGKIGLALDAVAAAALSGVLPAMSARFPAAAAGFRKVLELIPKDTHAMEFLHTCRVLERHPPGAEWTGVEEMTEK